MSVTVRCSSTTVPSMIACFAASTSAEIASTCPPDVASSRRPFSMEMYIDSREPFSKYDVIASATARSSLLTTEVRMNG